MDHLLAGRSFQFWEYHVSHGQLLVRSPKTQTQLTNVDVMYFGVQYVALPRHLSELVLAEASEEDIKRAEDELGKRVEDPDKVFIVVCNDRRHAIMAAGMKVMENISEIFDSPFQ